MSESSAEYQRHPRDGVEALVDRVRNLEREVGELRNTLLKQAGVGVEPDRVTFDRDVVVSDGGELEILDGGHIRVRHPDDLGGDVAVFFGRVVSESDRAYQGTGLLVQRTDRGDIFQARTDETGDAHTVHIRDNAGNLVLWVDAGSARGLARPTFSIPMHNAYWQSWGSTDSSSWTTLARGSADLWSAGFYTRYQATSDGAGTSGEVRLVASRDGADYVIGGPEAVGFTIAWYSAGGVMPSQLPIGGWVDFRLEARVTSGTGRVHAAVISLELRPA